MNFEAVIGLEIHVEMKTKSKMFSSAPSVYGKEPNTQIMPLDMAYPGTLPTVNKEAVIYADGELDYGLGGGICQVSSNLYNTVLKANLEIVERKNHSMTVNYLPIGCDATVSYGSVDFKFKNSRSYPIKIVATINSGVITISIYGVPEENEYTVDIITETLQKEDFETVYERTSSVPEGT